MPNQIFWDLVEESEVPQEGLGKFLSPSELLAQLAFRFHKRHNEWLLGRWTIKNLVHRLPGFSDLSLNEIETRYAHSGAPYLLLPGQGRPRINISVSHRDHLAFCAVTLDPALNIGADIEKIERRHPSFSEDYFSPKEMELVRTSPVDDWDMMITLIWSLKESMLKSLQVGLHMDTRCVETIGVNDSLGGRITQWQRAEVIHPAGGNDRWMAWWRRRGEYILTIVGFPKGPHRGNSVDLIHLKSPDVLSGSGYNHKQSQFL